MVTCPECIPVSGLETSGKDATAAPVILPFRLFFQMTVGHLKKMVINTLKTLSGLQRACRRG